VTYSSDQQLHVANVAIIDQLSDVAHHGQKPRPHRLHAKQVLATRQIYDLTSLCVVQSKGFLAQNRLSRIQTIKT